MNPNTIEYRNSPERLSEFKRKLFLRSTLAYIVTIAAAVVIVFFTQEEDFAGSLTIPIAYILFLLLVIIFSAIRRLKKQEKAYKIYRLDITDQSITSEQINLLPVTIYFNDIKAVNLNAWGNLEIKGSLPQQLIVVSYFAQNFDDLKERLSAIHPLTEKKRNGTLLYLLTITGVIGTMLVFYIAKNRAVIVVSGALILGLLGWSFYKIQTNTVINKQAKRSSWWLLIIFASIAASIYFRLFPF